MSRAITQDECNGLKAAFRQSLGLAGGGQFEKRTRVRGGQLSKYGAPEDWATDPKERIGNFPGIDVAVECDREALSPNIVGAMAELLGFHLVPIHDEAPGATAPVDHRDALILANEAADAVRELTLALDDGRMDAAEKLAVLKQLGELNRQTHNLIKRVGGQK